MDVYRSWIGGEWVDGDGTIDVVSPYDGRVVGRVASATVEQVDQAIAAAGEAFRSFGELPAFARAEILHKASLMIRARGEELARLLVEEAGKPIRDARVEVNRAAATFQIAAEEAKRIRGEIVPLDAVQGGEGRVAFTLREPLGVIAAITPFNVPLNLVAHKVAPAIAAGNTVVLKPASKTPLVAFRLAEILHEAGLPPGCLNVLCGPGGTLGSRLAADPRVSMVTFTGSPEVGKEIQKRAGFKRVALELGSNSAVVIEDVADMEKVVARCVQGGYTFAGQVCISVQRIYVNERLYDRFLEAYRRRVAALKIGPPGDEETEVSALISPQETARVLAWVEEAKAGGAHVQVGGVQVGPVLAPTVLTEATDDMKVCAAEVFGPVTSVAPYTRFDEALERVNNSRYGLQAGVYTQDVAKAFRAIKALKVGGVIINDVPAFRVDHMPYGGVKESGMGREGVPYAIEEMTELKLAVFNLA